MNRSDGKQTTVNVNNAYQSETLLDELFAKIEIGWQTERNPELVDRLAAEHPELAIDLYDFLGVIISSEHEADDERGRRSRARTKQWLEDEGFEIAQRVAAEERSKRNSTTSPTPSINTRSASSLKASRKSRRRNPTDGHNTHFNEAVILGVLAKHFATNGYPLGRLRRTKFAYLLHRHCEGLAQGFLKKAAGPYNPTIRYGGGEKIALNKGYVVSCRGGFIAGPKVMEAETYFDDWYGSDCLSWLERFRYYKNEELELLTTVDMAMVELRSQKSTVNVTTVKQVIAANSEWAKKLTRPIFCDTNLAKEIKKSIELFGC